MHTYNYDPNGTTDITFPKMLSF